MKVEETKEYAKGWNDAIKPEKRGMARGEMPCQLRTCDRMMKVSVGQVSYFHRECRKEFRAMNKYDKTRGQQNLLR